MADKQTCSTVYSIPVDLEAQSLVTMTNNSDA